MQSESQSLWIQVSLTSLNTSSFASLLLKIRSSSIIFNFRILFILLPKYLSWFQIVSMSRHFVGHLSKSPDVGIWSLFCEGQLPFVSESSLSGDCVKALPLDSTQSCECITSCVQEIRLSDWSDRRESEKGCGVTKSPRGIQESRNHPVASLRVIQKSKTQSVWSNSEAITLTNKIYKRSKCAETSRLVNI